MSPCLKVLLGFLSIEDIRRVLVKVFFPAVNNPFGHDYGRKSGGAACALTASDCPWDGGPLAGTAGDRMEGWDNP